MVKSIQEAGGKAAAVKADVSKLDEVTALFKDAAAAFPEEKIEVGGRAGEVGGRGRVLCKRENATRP